MQRTQKIIAVLALVLAIFFTGCSAGEPATATTSGGQTIVAGTGADTTAGSGSQATPSSKAAKGAKTATTTAKTGGAKSGSTPANSTGSAKGSGSKSTTTTRSAGSAKWQGGSANLIPTGGNRTTHKQTTKKHTTKRHTTTKSKTITCSITVECKNIQNHMGQLKSGHERFVPEDGVIIHRESHTVSRGSSAYDVLKLACNANGVRLTARPSSYGIYVVGINNLDEKDCGGASGWMYKVNGTAPMISCDKYKLDSGDNLVFYYVCTAKDR